MPYYVLKFAWPAKGLNIFMRPTIAWRLDNPEIDYLSLWKSLEQDPAVAGMDARRLSNDKMRGGNIWHDYQTEYIQTSRHYVSCKFDNNSGGTDWFGSIAFT